HAVLHREIDDRIRALEVVSAGNVRIFRRDRVRLHRILGGERVVVLEQQRAVGRNVELLGLDRRADLKQRELVLQRRRRRRIRQCRRIVGWILRRILWRIAWWVVRWVRRAAPSSTAATASAKRETENEHPERCPQGHHLVHIGPRSQRRPIRAKRLLCGRSCLRRWAHSSVQKRLSQRKTGFFVKKPARYV